MTLQSDTKYARVLGELEPCECGAAQTLVFIYSTGKKDGIRCGACHKDTGPCSSLAEARREWNGGK